MRASLALPRCGSVVLLSVAFALYSAGAGAVTLIRGGQAGSAIVVAAEEDARIRTAAEDLQYHFRKMTGADVAIVSSEGEAEGVPICLRLIREDSPLPEPLRQPDGYYPDGCLLMAGDRRLLLASPRPEGVVNAVYGLLEDHLGCRWFTPGEIGEHIPRRDTVEVEIPGGG